METIFLLSFSHGEDGLDPEHRSNRLKKYLKKKLWHANRHKKSSNSPQNQLEEAYQHALGEGHHSLVSGTSLK